MKMHGNEGLVLFLLFVFIASQLSAIPVIIPGRNTSTMALKMKRVAELEEKLRQFWRITDSLLMNELHDYLALVLGKLYKDLQDSWIVVLLRGPFVFLSIIGVVTLCAKHEEQIHRLFKNRRPEQPNNAENVEKMTIV